MTFFVLNPLNGISPSYFAEAYKTLHGLVPASASSSHASFCLPHWAPAMMAYLFPLKLSSSFPPKGIYLALLSACLFFSLASYHLDHKYYLLRVFISFKVIILMPCQIISERLLQTVWARGMINKTADIWGDNVKKTTRERIYSQVTYMTQALYPEYVKNTQNATISKTDNPVLFKKAKM